MNLKRRAANLFSDVYELTEDIILGRETGRGKYYMNQAERRGARKTANYYINPPSSDIGSGSMNITDRGDEVRAWLNKTPAGNPAAYRNAGMTSDWAGSIDPGASARMPNLIGGINPNSLGPRDIPISTFNAKLGHVKVMMPQGVAFKHANMGPLPKYADTGYSTRPSSEPSRMMGTSWGGHAPAPPLKMPRPSIARKFNSADVSKLVGGLSMFAATAYAGMGAAYMAGGHPMDGAAAGLGVGGGAAIIGAGTRHYAKHLGQSGVQGFAKGIINTVSSHENTALRRAAIISGSALAGGVYGGYASHQRGFNSKRGNTIRR